MKTLDETTILSQSVPRTCLSSVLSTVALLTLLAFAAFLTACGGSGGTGMTTPSGPIPGATTAVALLLSSTANDQFTGFWMEIQSITLTNKAGNTVTVFNTRQANEFIHSNGNPELFAIVTVPQDDYISATLACSGSSFFYEFINSIDGSQTTAEDAYGTCGPGTPTAIVNLPSPVTVKGNSMSLLLDLQVSQSATIASGPNGDPAFTYTIQPTFTLTALPVSTQPTNDQNGRLIGIYGNVLSIPTAGNSFTVITTYGWSDFGNVPSGSNLSFATNASTIYQGINGLSTLNGGMFVDLDAAIQPDGSLLATRVSVEDTTATNVQIGRVIQEYATPAPFFNVVDVAGFQQQGTWLSNNPVDWEPYQFDNNTVLKISGQLSNLSTLPFTPAVTPSNIVDGQVFSVASGDIEAFGDGYTHATTLTLVPETINGTVTSATVEGPFQVYTVLLAPYDLILEDHGQTSVTVYADSNTRMLASAAFGPGCFVRFTGLLFNDNGTLRMDCAQINDGVAF